MKNYLHSRVPYHSSQCFAILHTPDCSWLCHWCPHETTGNNSRLQSVDVRALVVSWWHFWYKHLHHTSGACIRSANGCSITLRRESPPSALPLCTPFELLWLLYREQIGQPYSPTESLLMCGELKLDFLCQKALRTASLLCFTKWKLKKQYS